MFLKLFCIKGKTHPQKTTEISETTEIFPPIETLYAILQQSCSKTSWKT